MRKVVEKRRIAKTNLGEKQHQGMESLLAEIKARRHSTLRQSGRALTRICATNFLALYRHCHCVATAETQRRDAAACITSDHFVD
jgi:7-keto-8-aminopelargonate synthetase-like enzyme